MKKIVAKFGGSNLKKKEDILKLVKVIKAYNRPMVIVVLPDDLWAADINSGLAEIGMF